MISLCEEALKGFDQCYQPYAFNQLLIVKESFQVGMSALAKGDEPTKHFPMQALQSYEGVIQDQAPVMRAIGENLFEVTTHAGHTFRIGFKPGKWAPIPILSTTLEDANGHKRWFTYQWRTQPEIPECFTKNAVCWVSSDSPLEAVLQQKESHEILCRIRDGKIYHPNDPTLVLATKAASDIPLIKRLAVLDDPAEQLIWKDEKTGHIRQIAFPRLHVTFERQLDQKGQVIWCSPQYPGFILDPSTVVTDLEPCQHYLVLKKGKERRVLIANRVIQPKLLSLDQQSLKSTPASEPKMYSLTLKPNGKLKSPKEVQTLLYLIHLQLRSHHYEAAKQWIDQLEKLQGSWEDKDKELVGAVWLELSTDATFSSHWHQQQDMHPFACALRIRLRWIAQRAFPRDPPPLVKNALKEDYCVCLDHCNALADAWLPPQDELATLKTIHPIWESQSSLFLTRLKKLFGELAPTDCFETEPQPYQPPKPQPLRQRFSVNYSVPEILTPELQQQMLAYAHHPLPIALQTRPGDAFILNILHDYRVAYTGQPPEEVEVLKQLLNDSQYSPDDNIQTLRHLYLHLLHDPTHAVSPLTNKKTLPTPDELQSLCEDGELGDYLLRECEIRAFDTPSEKEGLASKISSNKLILSALRPRKGIVILEPEALSDLGYTPADPVTSPPPLDLIKEGILAPIDPKTQKAAMQKEIAGLLELQALYTAAGTQSRTVEGIEERIQELQASLSDPPPAYALRTDQLKETEDWLTDQINGASEQAVLLEHELLALANRRSEPLQSEVYAGLIQPIGLRRLLLALARGDDSTIRKANPQLTAADMKQLKTLAIRYGIAKTDHQQYLRAQEAYGQALETANRTGGWDSEAAQQAATTCVATLTCERAYDPNQHLGILLFEAIADIRLRDDQYAALKTLTKRDAVDYELEARTGFGKSKVLIPLWLFLNRKPGQLTLMATTSSLLYDQLTHLQEFLGDDFDMTIQKMSFTHQQASDLATLKWIEEQLENAKKTGKVILLSMASLQGLTGLALKQTLSQEETFSEKGQTLLNIRRSLHDAFAFIDESTACLGVRTRFDYASGQPIAFERTAALRIVSFYQQVVLSSAIQERWSLDFLPSNGKEAITAFNYHEVQRILAEETLKFLEVPESHQSAVLAHLTGTVSQEAEAYVKSLSQEKQQLYAYCHKQLTHNLKHCLVRRYKSRYELGQDRIARPLETGSQKPNSEFTDRDDLANFTLQGLVKTHLDDATVGKAIEELKTLLFKQGSHALRNHPVYELLLEIKKRLKQKDPPIHLPLLKEFTPAHSALITTFLNSSENQDLFFRFIGESVLTQITTRPYKISGNSYTALRPLGRVHLASATVAPEVLPPRIKTLQKKSAVTGNLSALWKHSERTVIILPDDPYIALEELLKSHPKKRVFTDIGGLFNDITQPEIIKLLFHCSRTWDPPVSGVTFYDDQKRCMLWLRGEAQPVPRESVSISEEELFVFIRQAHVVGSDTPMAPFAQGVNTVSYDTDETLLLQGIGRMRGLQTGQKGDFATSQRNANVIRKELHLADTVPLQLGDLLVYAQKMEMAQKQKDALFALRSYLKELIENQLWQAVTAKTLSEESLPKYFHWMQTLLSETTQRDPLSGLFDTTEEVSSKEAVARLKASVLDPLHALLKKYPELEKIVDIEAITSDFDGFVNWDILGDTLLTTSRGEEDDLAETEVVQEKLQDIDLTAEQESDRATHEFIPSKPMPWDGHYRHLLAKEPEETMLGIDIYRSPNLPILEAGKNLDAIVRKPAYQTILKIDRFGHISVLAMDLADASEALTWMDQAKGKSDAGYFLLSGGQLLGTEGGEKPVALKELIPNAELRTRLGILTKLLAGEERFSRAEREWMRHASPTHRAELLSLVNRYQTAWPKLATAKKLLMPSSVPGVRRTIPRPSAPPKTAPPSPPPQVDTSQRIDGLLSHWKVISQAKVEMKKLLMQQPELLREFEGLSAPSIVALLEHYSNASFG